MRFDVRRAAAYAAAVAILLAPAIWNRFPIMYDDVGGYLDRWPTGTLGNGRSIPYGLLLWVTRDAWFIPAILLQAGVTVWIVGRSLKIFGLGRSPWAIVPACAALAGFSGAAFFCSQVLPDAWAAPAVLALHLLAWHPDRFTRAERTAAAAVIAFAGAAHMATLGVLAGLALVYLMAWLSRDRLGVAPLGVWHAASATAAGLVLLLAADGFVAGRFALTPGGDVYLFGRLTESGLVGTTLREHCPRDDWHLCAYQDALPKTADELLWEDGSPLWNIGGWDDPRARAEMQSITLRSLLDHPLAHMRNAAALTAEQFLTVGTANSIAPIGSWHLGAMIDAYAPWLKAPFAASRQQRETIDLAWWSAWIVIPVTLAGCFALPLITAAAWRRHRHAALLAIAVLLALAGNAFICGVFSGPHDRYQARLAWLGPLAAVLALAAMRRQRSARGGADGGVCDAGLITAQPTRMSGRRP